MTGTVSFFLDFDDALTGPAVQDMWMLLGGDDYGRRLELSFLKAMRPSIPLTEKNCS